ncbi:hypothetical protein [Segniliparus rugosus]|uniref:Uncharacterized protein n=1 Tax=Segniliparus rugosus (strain ATCC BAA-974 / DSM 45345 / CCUG 50838 / CIP 108380 / JCM 13579 / CDC 945) TaxID=679197 RepID=E5XS21_SEGRC|nr:hypothetical protein [Segniliparus rugosus]EFV12806.2 hypothetical protein HMPREF9336_02293 [Segniliparus rugosus ATCC BAA-974]
MVAGSGDVLPPPRDLLSFEERVRLMEEVLPKLTATEQSACGRARATVGYGCSLDELWLDWDRLREDLEQRRGPRNELIGAEHLARIIESAVVAAIRKLLVAVNDAFHKPAPSKADLENRYYDEYWGLPEHLRPDTVDEYIRERKAAEGPRATAEQQRESDERAARERIAKALAALPSDPKEILRSEPGVVLTPEVIEAEERTARTLERLQRIDTATVRFQGKDDERSPSVIVTSDYSAPFALWLHPEVFARVGSRLDRVIPACAAKARAKFTELVEGPGEEAARQGKAV